MITIAAIIYWNTCTMYYMFSDILFNFEVLMQLSNVLYLLYCWNTILESRECWKWKMHAILSLMDYCCIFCKRVVELHKLFHSVLFLIAKLKGCMSILYITGSKIKCFECRLNSAEVLVSLHLLCGL